MLGEQGAKKLGIIYASLLLASFLWVLVGFSLLTQGNAVVSLLGVAVFAGGAGLARFYHGRLCFINSLDKESSL